MAESKHSLLAEADFETTRPPRAWNPLGPSSPELEYAFLPAYREERQSFSEEVLREVGLGITNTSGENLARGKRDSISSETSPATTPGFFKTPQETPATPHQHHQLPGNCPSRTTVLQRRLSWVPVTIFILAFYATVFSGVYLAIAIRKPRWSSIGTGQSLGASTANLLCAFFAKTIELSFVTICVAFLGQVLSRRALTQDSKGVSISDMSMRAWIMQPGSMLVHWETVRYSALTFLGLIALSATFVAMLYTTAAEALVSPKLSMGPLESTVIWGKVYASWGNPDYLGEQCQTPIPVSMDPVYRNSTCLQMEHVGQAYHNFEQWLTSWVVLVESDIQTSDQLESRPVPTASMWDNTTITGSWIEIQNMTELSLKHGRMVNNVTMALPHAGVPAAAMDPRNDIEQPQAITGEGQYVLEASVPSPAVNVLCVGMNKTELDPLVYSSWPYANFSPTEYSISPPSNIPGGSSWLNRTVVDDIFGFGKKYGQQPPVFGTFPESNNTILNTTGAWPTDAIYLLGKPSISIPEYVMCAIRGKETGVCSTHYEAASSGASLSATCEDKSNTLQHNRYDPSFVEGLWSADWKNVAADWASALSLGSGITASQASTERIIMQMMPSYSNTSDTYSLNPLLPSVSEALAVMAGCTLILSSQNAPFVQGWNYTPPPDILPVPAYQHFPVTLQSMSYASGGTEQWQGIFYVILVFAFLTSAVCLVFMIVEARGHQITDFTEPQNLFALAVNSPQSSRLHGACGGGPVGRQLKERWVIGMEEMDAHYYIRTKAETVGSPGGYGGNDDTSYRGMEQMEIDDGSLKAVSPAVDEFRRVSKRRSWLARFY